MNAQLSAPAERRRSVGIYGGVAPRVSGENIAGSTRRRLFQRLPLWCWLVSAMLAAWGAFSANPLLTPCAIMVLPILATMVWFHAEPPALVFACAMQWLQATAAVFYADVYGTPLNEFSGNPEFEKATWLSLAAVLAVALGMRFAVVGSKRLRDTSIAEDAARVNLTTAFLAYLSCFCIGAVAERTAASVPSIAQLVYALATLKWMAIFILGYCVLERRSGYMLLTTAIVIELISGALGFFSGFKGVFFVLLVVTLASPAALRGRRLFLVVATLIALFLFGVVWSAIKREYRDFLNQGSEQQVVAVSAEDSFDKLTDLIQRFTWDNFLEGFDSMVLRVSYVNLFALTIANVPERVPYEHGTLWMGALKHSIMPRLLFPNKPALNDSERANLYTGFEFAGAERGTSIGIGYVAESYVDFGPVWMFMPVLLLGIFYGFIYRAFFVHTRRKLIGVAIGSAILIFGAYTIETSNIKLVGGNLAAVIVIGGLYLMFGRVFQAWLEQRSG